MKFLIVDDDERITMLVCKLLSPYGKCTIKSNAPEAVTEFKKSLEAGSPFNAVFMDIVMPETDGHEAVKALRETEKAQGVEGPDTFKLVMISACSDTKNVCKSFFQGYADAYVAKPDLKDKLVEELRNIKLIG